jgi:hypothetical protein
VPDRVALVGIVYVLRKEVTWCDVPVQVVGCSGVQADVGCGTGQRLASGLAFMRHS